jgi:hypothetical protein
MLTRFIAGLVIAATATLVAPAPSAAQEAPEAQPGQPPAPPRAPAPAQRPRGEREVHQEVVAQRMQQAEERRKERAASESKGVNVRIDATVIESRGEQVTGRKVLTVTLVDGAWGSVRSTQQVPFQPKGSAGFNYRTAPLNMDARATLRDDGRVKIELTLEYRGAPMDAETSPGPAPGTAVVNMGALDEGIKQSVAVVLDSGKPLIVAQSADAVGDRRVALELKATVLK